MDGFEIICGIQFISWDMRYGNLKYSLYKCHISLKFWTSEHLIHDNTTPISMDLGFSIVSDILFIKQFNDVG